MKLDKLVKQIGRDAAANPKKAALLGLMHRYLGGLMDVSISLLEIHKLMYFLQEAGEPLRLRFAKGTIVSYRGTWLTRGPATPYGGHWRLDGSRGTLEFTFRGAFEEREKLDRLILHRPGEPPETMPLPDMPCKDRKGALDAFARWIQGGSTPEGASTATDNLHSLAAMFAAIRSARQGGVPVRVADVLEEAP